MKGAGGLTAGRPVGPGIPGPTCARVAAAYAELLQRLARPI